MDSKVSTVRKIQENIRQILLEDWDPIGISDVYEAQDEYDGYVGKVYRLLASLVPIEQLVELLSEIETEEMGLTPNTERIHKAAVKLYRLNVSF